MKGNIGPSSSSFLKEPIDSNQGSISCILVFSPVGTASFALILEIQFPTLIYHSLYLKHCVHLAKITSIGIIEADRLDRVIVIFKSKSPFNYPFI